MNETLHFSTFNLYISKNASTMNPEADGRIIKLMWTYLLLSPSVPGPEQCVETMIRVTEKKSPQLNVIRPCSSSSTCCYNLLKIKCAYHLPLPDVHWTFNELFLVWACADLNASTELKQGLVFFKIQSIKGPCWLNAMLGFIKQI